VVDSNNIGVEITVIVVDSNNMGLEMYICESKGTRVDTCYALADFVLGCVLKCGDCCRRTEVGPILCASRRLDWRVIIRHLDGCLCAAG